MNTRRMMTMLVGVLATAGPLAAQERADSGGFVVRQGADTVAVETFRRTGDRLTGELTVPSSGVRVAYTATVSPDGLIPRMELRSGTAPAAAVARFALDAGTLPYLNLSPSVLEQILRRARALGSGSATIPLLNLQGGGTIAATVEPLSADSVRILLGPGVEIRAATDAEGRLLGATIPSQNVVIERTALADAQPGAAAPSPPPYADRATFAEQEVVVGSGEWALPGTLSLPNGAGPFPAVVLVHGSGPADRDETVGPNKPFRDLAWGLASRGVAVLRYDKRTRVHGHKFASSVPNSP